MRRQKKLKVDATRIPAGWIYDVEDEYKPSNDIFCEDDMYIANIKKVIYNSLDDTERRIILAYAELGNVRDCAKLFKVSPTTIWSKIKEIRTKIQMLTHNAHSS